MASPYSRTARDGYEPYSRNENSGIRDTRKETSPLGATMNDNSFDFGFDWLEKNEPVRDYNWDSTKNDDYRQSRVVGWNALGDTVRNEAGETRHDPNGRTMRENLGATTKRVDLGETGQTRREEYEISKSQRRPDENPYIINQFDQPGATRRVPLTEDSLGSRDKPYRGRQTDLRETHSIDHKLPDYDYVYDRQHGDEDRHNPYRKDDYLKRSWHSMAADKNLMAGWHDMFGRIRTKWNGHNGIDDPTSGKSDRTSSSSSGYNERNSRLSGRCKILIIAILVFILLAMGAVITTVMLLPQAPADVIGTYKLTATATNLVFTEDMTDPNSETFQTISREFCEEIDKKRSEDFGYVGCVVTGLQNGSVVIYFTIVINENGGSQATTNDTIFAFLGFVINQGTPTTLGNFSISLTIILQPFTQLIESEESTIPTKMPFNGTCGNTNTQRCKTKRSICKVNVCACASDKIYVEDGDSCNLIECSEVAVIHNGNITQNGSKYGSHLKVECDDGYEWPSAADVICQTPDSWTGIPDCSPVVCEGFVVPPNAVNESDVINNRNFEDKINVQCKPGYKAEGAYNVTCQANKKWSKSPNCTMIECDDITNISYGTVTNLTGTIQVTDSLSPIFPLDSTVEIECDDGYEIDGNSSTLHCMENGTWSPNVTCIPVLCDEYIPPDDALIIVSSNANDRTFGSSLTIECTDGLSFADGTVSTELTCNASKIWSGEQTCGIYGSVEFDMEDYTLDKGKEGTLVCNVSNFTDSQTVTLEKLVEANITVLLYAVHDPNIGPNITAVMTEENYNNTIHEGVLSVWVNFAPVNEDDCGTYVCRISVYDGNNVLDTKQSYASVEVTGLDIDVSHTSLEAGEDVTVDCRSFSQAPMSDGDLFIETMTDGDNSFTTVIDDLPPIQSNFSGCQSVSRNSHTIQTNNLSGTFFVRCGLNASGSVSYSPEKNITVTPVMCDEEFVVTNENAIVLSNDSSTMRVLGCKEGYQIVGNETVICNNGSWSGSPTCIEKDCGDIPDISNGSLTNTSGTTYKAYAVFACDAGFNMNGKANITCLASGSWESLPQCEQSDCGEYIAPQNAIVENLTISCDVGFDLAGNSSIECQSNGNWNDFGECLPIVCGAFVTPDNATSDANTSDEFNYEDKVNVTCNPGYTSVGDTVAVCNGSGFWINVIACDPIPCKELDLAGVAPLNASHRFGDSVIITCQDGYVTDNETTVTCSITGEWESLPDCIPRVCDDLMLPDNANSLVAPTGIVFGQVINISCDDGYEISGSISTLRCMENGTWSLNITCIPVLCSGYIPPDEALFVVSSNANDLTFGSSLTIECKDGLSFADGTASTELTCNASKIWSGEQTCGIYGSVAFDMNDYTLDKGKEGTLVCNVSNFTDSQTVTLEKLEEDNITVLLYAVHDPNVGPNITAVMTDENYTHTIHEGDLSVWVNFAPVNEDDCGTYVCRISVYDGNNVLDTKRSDASVEVTGLDIDVSHTSIEAGEKVTVDCRSFSQAPMSDGDLFIETKTDGDNSFTAVIDDLPPIQSNFSGCQSVSRNSHTIHTNNLSGTFFVRCGLNASGSVSYSPEKNVTVTPVICDEELVVTDENAIVLSNDSSTMRVLGCKEGYQIVGNETVICKNGSWSERPSCIEKDCGDIPDISNGSLTNTSGTTYNDYAVFACAVGFSMNGKANITCLASGSWESLPQCEQSDCGEYITPPNAIVENLTISCDVGFDLAGNSSIECQSNGNWNDFGECLPIMCGAFVTPENATSDANTSDEFNYEDKVNVTCNPGYTSVGDTVAVCNGSGFWINVIACDPIPCKELDLAGVAPLNASHRFGDSVIITCQDGYVTDNETTVTCSITGEWESLPDCIPRVCDDLMLPDNANSLVTPTGIVFGQVINISCDDGYEISGSISTLRCMENGTWSLNVTCIPVLCSGYIPPDEALFVVSSNANDLTFGSSLTIECKDGLSFADGTASTELTCNASKIWSGEQTCGIYGEVDFGPDHHSLNKGEEQTIVCYVTDYSDGQNVVIAKSNESNAPNRLYIFSNNSGVIQSFTPTEDAFQFNYTVNGSDIAVEMKFLSVGNESCGNYACALIVYDDDDILDTKYSRTNVSVNGFGKPSISHEDDEQLDAVDIQCTGYFDKHMSDDELYLETRHETNGSYNKINNSTTSEYAVVDCQHATTKTYVIPSEDIGERLFVRCGIYSNGTFLNSNETVINGTADAYGSVAFDMNDYTLDKGKEGMLVCNVSNFTDSQTVTLEKLEEANITVLLYEVQYPNIAHVVTEGNYNHTTNEGDLSVWVNFAPVTEDDCGTYICRISVYDGDTVLDAKQSYANVEVTGLDIDVSHTSLEAGEEVTVDCRSFSQAPLSDGALFIETKNDGDNSFNAFIDDSPPIQSNFSGCQFVTRNSHTIQTYNRSGTFLVRCGLNASGGVSYSPEKNITVTHVTCDVEFVVPDENAIVLSNDSATMKVLGCKEGYQIEGNDTVICKNGNWSDFGECLSITCGPFVTPENATSDASTSGEFKYEDKVNVTCNPGYTSEGDTAAVCNGSGVWINVTACDPITCQEFDNQTIVAGVAPLNATYRFGDLVDITCQDGYLTENETTVSCSTTGEWDSLPDCLPIECDVLVLPEYTNSTVAPDGILFGQEINISCVVGFKISDNSTIQCSANGEWKELPSCMPIVCDNITLSNNSYIDNSSEIIMYGNEIVPYCYDGYVLSDNSSVKCNEMGKWNEFPTCNLVECDMFPLPDNMALDSAQTNETDAHSFNTTLNVSCDIGFELIGKSEMKCLSNGSWTVLPTCNITSCGAFMETITDGSVEGSTGSEFNDTVTIQCDNNSTKSIRCLANGTWERTPKCKNVSCDNFEVQNGQMMMDTDTFPIGSSVEIKCDEGYEISGNVSTTECVGNGTWSHNVTCTPVLCMAYVPVDGTVNDVNNNETEFPYGSHMPIECKNGLTFYDGSVSTNLTCNATGMWAGEQNCGIIGEVDFGPDHHSLNKGEEQTIVCYVTDYSDGQNVVIAKSNKSNAPNRLYIFSNNSGVIQSFTPIEDAFQFNYTVNGSDIAVEMKFLSVGNESCGNYACALIVYDDDDILDTKYSRTNVSVNGFGKPSISHEDDEQLDAVDIQCTGYFDKHMSDDELYLETRHETNGSYNKINNSTTSEYAVVNCQHATTKSYVIPSEDIGEQLFVRCGIYSNGTFLNSEETAINGTAHAYATFENDSYAFAVGNYGVIVCDVNGENVSHVVVYDSNETSLVNVTATGTEQKTGVFTVNETSFQDTKTRVAVNVDLQDWCANGGVIGSDTYTCEVTYKNGNKRSAETNVTVYKSASIQAFVKSVEIVEDKDTTAEKLFYCKGELGNPKGIMEIEYDRNDGVYETFLAPGGLDNRTDGWIVDVTNEDSECGGVFQSVGFALRKVTKAMHLTSMRCAIKPPDDTYKKVVTKPSVLKVVEASYCNKSTTYEFIPHPYYCHSAVACFAIGTIQSVPPRCWDDQCYNTNNDICDSCEAIGCEYEPIVCLTKTISSPEGGDVDFLCNTVDIGEPVTVVSVNGSDFHFDETTDEQVIADNVNLTITDNNAVVSVFDVSCNNDEVYELTFNNKWNTALTLRVETDPDEPSIEVKPDVPNANEEMVIVCNGSVGRDKDNKQRGSVHLQVANSKDDSYGVYEIEAVSREVVLVDCAYIERATYSITPGLDWNGTYVRCLTWDESVVFATSANYTVLLNVPDLYCNPVSTTTLIGDDVSFECELQDIINVTSIEIKVDGDASTVTVVNATIDSLPWTSESNSVGIEVDIPDVTDFTYKVTNISCDQEGEFTVLINDKASAVMSIAIVSPPSEPTVYVESDTSENQLLEINCTADIGRDDKGCAVSELELEVKFENETQFNTYTSSVTSTVISENCKHTGYVNLTFYPDGSWNNSVIRCVTRNGNNTYNVSAEETITLKPSSIHFDKKSGTGIVGENYTMTCIADNMPGLQDIEITKDGINIIDDDGVFTLRRDINDTSAHLTIERTIKCGDDGMYYCKPKGTSVEAQAETLVSVIWNSQKPTIDLSADIVEDSPPWAGYGTSCTGEIGYNNASIYFQTNKNGAFETLTEAELVVIDYNPSECSNVKTISFTQQYTADWNGTTFRCVVQDTDRRQMDTELINVVPKSICNNKSTDTIEHPFDCRAVLKCINDDSKNIVSNKYCTGADECYNENTYTCVACEEVGRCREDPSDIVPYMECTSTVATIGGQLAYINCSLHHTTVEQPNATDVTLLQNGTLIIKTDTPTGNDPDTATYVPQSGDTTPTLVVRSTTIDIVFGPVSCIHKGEYLLRYDNGTSTIEDTGQLVVQRTASAAHLSKSTDAYYRGVETTLSCIGPIGQPKGTLEIMYKRNSSDDFEPLSDSTNSMTSTYDPDNCTYIGELHYTFIVRDALDGYEYRCKSVGHDSQEFYSHTEILNVATPAINFEDEQVTAEIGTTFEAKCMISKADGASGATITLTSNGTTNELCAVDGTTTFTNATVTSQSGYTAFVLEDPVNWSLVVSGTAACHLEGTLHCFSPSDSQIKSSSELVITRPSSNPDITVPVAFAGRLIPENEFTCTADIGYPSLGRVLKMQKKAASETSFVDDVEVEASGGCEISEAKATKSNVKFELADNGTEYKCVVYDTKEDTVVTKSSTEILQVFPNDCPTDTAATLYLPYPLDCFHRLWCYSNGLLAVQPCSVGSCFNATSTECDIPSCSSCPP